LAINLLVRKKIIEVEDGRGYVLDFSLERKGKTRLYYRLHPSVYNYVEKPVYYDPTSAEFALDLGKKCTELVQKMRITKETLQN